MIATLRAVREELADALASVEIISGSLLSWRVYSTLPATPELPCIIVRFPDRIAYNQTIGGHSELTFTVGAFHGTNDMEKAQAAIEDLAEGNLAEALHNHTPTTWRALHVEDASNFRPEQIGEANCIAVDFTITLIA